MLLKSIRKYGFIHVVTIHGNFKCAHKCHAWNHLASSVYTKMRQFSVVRRVVTTIHFGLMETKSFIRCRHSTTQIMTKFSVSESELRPCYQDSPLNTIHKRKMDLTIPASIIFDYDYDKIEKNFSSSIFSVKYPSFEFAEISQAPKSYSHQLSRVYGPAVPIRSWANEWHDRADVHNDKGNDVRNPNIMEF